MIIADNNQGGIMTIKKFILLLLIVPLVFLIQSCGNGAGSGYTSPGKGPGLPSYIKLYPARYVAQTNGCIDIYAEVHDETGEILANIPVTFTNLSEPLGVILDRCGGSAIAPPVIVNTDSWGRAKVTLYSTTPGFTTVLAQTYTGSQPRERKTVLFSQCDTYECLVLAPSLHLDVDSVPGDSIYNEASDFIIFEPPPDPDNTVELLATVRNAYGFLVQDTAITWGSDHAEAVFTRTEDYTNVNGQAVGIVEVTPMSIRDTDTHVTVWAMAPNVGDTGAYDIVTLFLQPVVVSTITVMADPSVVGPEENSTVTATATLSSGDPVPDGVTVLFSTCLCEDPPDCTICNDPCGYVDPFAQTLDGIAAVTFTAPALPTTCRVTARINSATGFTPILVTDVLSVVPDSLEVNGTVGGIATYTIFGGVAPYIVISDSTDPNLVPVPATVLASGDTFDVVVPAGTATDSVRYTIRDAMGDEVNATLNITTDALTVFPSSITVFVDGVTGGTATFTIYGGDPEYTIFVSTVDPNVQPDTTTVANSGDSFNVVVPATACPTSATYTIRDQSGATVTATLTVTSTAPALSITIVPTTICENDGGCPAGTNTANVTIAGGIAPFNTVSNAPTVIPDPGPGAAFPITPIPDSITVNTAVTLSTSDSCGTTRTATVNVTNQ
jgi:hypothetical protein